MPSYRPTTPTVSLERFDVVGQDSPERGLVGHAGLAKFAGDHVAARIPVIDMAPPLRVEDQSGNIVGHVVGSATLTDDEAQKIKTFIDRHAFEHLTFFALRKRQLVVVAPQMYCVYPHASPYREADGRYSRTRFSCAGFAFEAYKRARIELVEISALPPVEMAVIRSAYARQMSLLEAEGVSLAALGLQGAGPWPILFCGYLFHALGRNTASIRHAPYAPSPQDRYFL